MVPEGLCDPVPIKLLGHLLEHPGRWRRGHQRVERGRPARGHTVEVIAAGSATTPREERTSDGYAPTSLDHAQAAVREPSLRVTRLPSPLFYSGGAPEALPRGGLGGARAALSFSARLTITTLRRAGRVDP